MKYIAEKDVIDVLAKHYAHNEGVYTETLLYRIKEDIKAIPASDVATARHGEWTLHKDSSATCSECGRTQFNAWDLDNWDNFCHHCGADMRGGVKHG